MAGEDQHCPSAAVMQMTSGPDVADNLRAAGRHLEAAAATGARLAVLPENFACMPNRETERLAAAEPDGAGPIQDFLAERADTLGMWIVGGSIALQAGSDQVWASCLVYDDTGTRRGRYDKIHLFDVSLPGGRESYRESTRIRPGSATVVMSTPIGRLGLSICYDIRFPELYRALLDQGMEVLAVPSAFTAATGRAHWDTLLQARAIENLCWVLAPAQHGRHPNGRETHGHSMIVDPWGRVLERIAAGPGSVSAEIDLAAQAKLRSEFPTISHRRIRPGRDETDAISINS
jgi:nitrilase